MKQLLVVIFFLIPFLVRGQNEYAQCTERKNKAFEGVLNKGGIDSADGKKLLKESKDWVDCIKGKTIPAFMIRDINGKEISSENLKGKVIVINNWFTSCPPCIAEMPALNKLVEEYKGKDVFFLGLTHDTKKKLKKKFLRKYKFDFTIVPDGQTLEDLLGAQEHPMTFIIDQNSKVKDVWAGGAVGEKAKTEAYDKAKPIIDELLKAE